MDYGFPQIFGLGIMIFFLGLIPVAGVIVSLIPLSLIAIQHRGIYPSSLYPDNNCDHSCD